MNDGAVSLVRVALASTVVLGLLAALAWGLQAWTRRSLTLGAGGAWRTAFASRPRRLALQESLVLDTRRRVVIVRIDEQDQVILLGATTELVLSHGTPNTRDEGV